MNRTIGYRAIAVTLFALALVALAACGSGGGDASKECIDANAQAGLDESSLQLIRDRLVSEWSDGDIFQVALAYAEMEMNISPAEMSRLEDACEGLSDKLEEEVNKRGL